MPKITTNFWQCADSDVKWHSNPVADAARRGGVCGGQGHFHLMANSWVIQSCTTTTRISHLCLVLWKAVWKSRGHHGNSADPVATPWRSETFFCVCMCVVTFLQRSSSGALDEVILSHDKKKDNIYTQSIFCPHLHSVLMVYLDTYSLERVSMATGSLDSTTSRSYLLSVWHCVSDSFRCFGEQEEGNSEIMIDYLSMGEFLIKNVSFTSVQGLSATGNIWHKGKEMYYIWSKTLLL